jgi:hypothetical protein
MNPEFIDSMSWEMAEVYGAITDQILVNLAHYFPFYKPGQPLPQSAFEYQANMLAQMGQVSKDTIRIIRNGLAGADGALQGVLEQAIIDSVRKAQPELLEAVKQGVLSPISKPVVSPSQMRAFNLYYTQAADKLNLVNTVMLESTQSAYQQCVSDVVSDIGLADSMNRVQIALDTAAGETVTGVESWNRALQHATDRLKETGIVGFIDHAGRRWSAEAYVAMDIRTTVANTARAAVWETNQDFGNDLYQVSYHDGARPLCYPWQLKVISSTDNARTVTDLDGNEIEVIAQSATSYGKPAGLFGINCKHYPTPFIPGVSIIRGQVQPEKANEIAYEQSQEQRRLERKLREERRNVLMAKAQGASPEEIGRLQAKANKTSADIDEFCAQTGLPRQRNRERVYTKREFPDANRYDVNTFERVQKEAIDKYFDNGGAQQGYTFGQMTPNVITPPVPPITPAAPATPTAKPVINTDVATFNPANTIAEAESFAQQTFVDTKMWASQGVSLQGISVDSANLINERLSEFYNGFKVDKFSSLVAPAGNTKIGKAVQGAHAGFNTMNRAMYINRTSFRNPAKAVEAMAKERELVADYFANPDKYSRLDKFTRKMLENSRASGRFSVAETLEEVLDHECGHALEKALRGVSNYETIVANMGTYAPGVSGYAQEKFGEYVAESFCAWRKGGIPIDPEIAKAFEELRR